MGGGPPSFTRSSTSSMLLGRPFQRGLHLSPGGLSPSVVGLSRPFRYADFCNPHMSGPTTPGRSRVWAHSVSLAATKEVEVSFRSSRYLDVSVPWVTSDGLCIQPPVKRDGCPPSTGFPIRKSWDRGLLGGSPRHIAACHVLHRLLAPRHPPCTLNNLTTIVLASRSHRTRRCARGQNHCS